MRNTFAICITISFSMLAVIAIANTARAQEMTMPSATDLLSPMTQEASGTAWLPQSSPMYGKMKMYPNGDMLMLHGAVTPRYLSTGSRRGDTKFDAPNWFMGMYNHPLGSRDQLGVRLMMSLDPITEGGYGYPLLFQTGESWHDQPLHDRQHPHDLISELSVSYSHLFAPRTSGYLYLGYPGEPAIGPPTFMHRLLALDLPDAPIGHHWQDATHITWGVMTAGVNLGNRFKLEGSLFNGREPDEDRYKPDPIRLDSQSGRLFYNPDNNNSFQISYGFQKNAEGDGINQHRTTASWTYNKPLGADANLTSTIAWGQNDLNGEEGKTNSYLAEGAYQTGRHSIFTRLESIQKSGHELVLPEAYHDNKYTVGTYTLGYIYDLNHGRGIDTGLGFAVTLNTQPSGLNPFYGNDSTPVGFQIMFRLRSSRMQMGKGMAGMKMGDMKDMPGIDHKDHTMPMPEPAPANPPAPPATPQPAAPEPAKPEAPAPQPAVTVIRVTATIAPNPPKARRKETITLQIMGTDNKPLTGATIKATVGMTNMDMGTQHPAFKEIGNGKYEGQVQFSMPGPWRVSVTVTPKGAEEKSQTTHTFDYKVVR